MHTCVTYLLQYGHQRIFISLCSLHEPYLNATPRTLLNLIPSQLYTNAALHHPLT